ncbi:hypothetical protein BMS3Abin15_00789 [bacterium BMS3Abin15]|nr:hypothetical protein BMS3Abin15_00789 [bacterium BMS3Abin15]HDH07618.1 hypothetical protein [Candidatus Moranbacteria bacterium]HDZ85611.1 hypothetical protein [Candidatus Moranbacteria bacterium]
MNIHPWINYFTNQGVPQDTVELLLVLPIVATFIALVRQVIGIKAFGIYTPLLVIFAFLATGIKYGAVVFISVILVGMLMRLILRRLRLLYLPRVAITLTVVAFAMLAVLVVGGSFQRTGLAAVSIFPLLIMVIIVEKFIAAQIEKGNRTAILLAVETLAISVAGYYLASWEGLINSIVSYPWAVLLIIPFNVFLGKWTGLRLSEYWRFREIIKKS